MIGLLVLLAAGPPDERLAMLIDRYLAGEQRQAVAALAEIARPEIVAPLDWLAARATETMGPDRTARLLKGASLLFVDRAIAAAKGGDHPSFGWFVKRAESAADAADRVQPISPASAPFAPTWRRYVGLVSFALGDFESALRTLRANVERDPTDVATLLALGAVEEAAADSRIQKPRLEDQTLVTSPAVTRYRQATAKRHGLLKLAQSRFRTVLATDPASIDARLHLARVLLLDDRADDAEAELTRVATAAAWPDALCVHALLLGKAREKQGNLEGAVEAYRRALGAASGPTAALALGHALDQLGRTTEASLALEQALPRGDASDPRDPWRLWLAAPAAEAGLLYDWLLELARR